MLSLIALLFLCGIASLIQNANAATKPSYLNKTVILPNGTNYIVSIKNTGSPIVSTLKGLVNATFSGLFRSTTDMYMSDAKTGKVYKDSNTIVGITNPIRIEYSFQFVYKVAFNPDKYQTYTVGVTAQTNLTGLRAKIKSISGYNPTAIVFVDAFKPGVQPLAVAYYFSSKTKSSDTLASSGIDVKRLNVKLLQHCNCVVLSPT